MSFDPDKSFDENLTLFLVAAEAIDADCAKILAANIAVLCREGDPVRSQAARAQFHNAVQQALEALPHQPEVEA